jgi:spore maturation protein CgeB
MCFKSRIVIAAETWFGSTTFGVAQGFRRLGWEVVEVSPRAPLMQDRSLFSRVLGRLITPFNIAIYNNDILRAVNHLSAEYFLTVKGSFIQPKTLKLLASRGVKAINYYPDFRFTYASINQATFPLYSIFVTTKSFQLEKLQRDLGNEKVRFLHHGYCSDVHYPPEIKLLNQDKVPDVLYIGTYTAHKEKLFSQVLNSYPELRLCIYGNGWDNAKCSDMLKACIKHRPVFGLSYAQLVNAAKINLAIHMGVADDSGWQDLVSTRSFELPACKGFMLHVDNPEIRQLYDVGQEIDVFSTADDLCEKIRFYLKNESKRLQMIEKAYQRCVPAYSYDQRALDMASFIKVTF